MRDRRNGGNVPQMSLSSSEAGAASADMKREPQRVENLERARSPRKPKQAVGR